jgi:transcriptional regulator with GAF, ATPase, and Fis domain
MPCELWVASEPEVSAASVSAVTQALRAAGGAPVTPDDSGSPGIVLVSSASARAAACVAERCARAAGRILVVAVAGVCLDARGTWGFLEAGAADVVAWDDAEHTAASIVGRVERWARIDGVLASDLVRRNLIGHSRAWRRFLEDIVEAALFSTAPVVISGETGTGKELGARLIHSLRPGRKKELVVVDCSTIVPDLAGSELFGHERGAFTGADRSREGAFELADGGTLFLDEVGELPGPLQAQLLRAVQERTYKRVGGNAWKTVDFRLVCATNRDLPGEVEAGRFRRDLYYRLAGVVCHAPPLGQRTEDIVALACHFFTQLIPGQPTEISAPVRAHLVARDYPGNVRDLRRLVEAMARRHVGPGPVTVGAVPEQERPRGNAARAVPGAFQGLDAYVRHALDSGLSLKEIERAARDAAMRLVLQSASVIHAARALGVCERTVQHWKNGRRSRSAGSIDGGPADDQPTRNGDE